MYRKEYAEMLADRLDVNEEDADAILLAFLDILKETWNHGHAVCIKNFGVFELRTISSKIGRNPKTMEDHLIPESFKPSFRSTKGLREEITRSVREKRVAND